MKMEGRMRAPLASPQGTALERLWTDRRGATAVEFAIVALPFLFMVFAIIELALVFMVNVSLDNATAIEARKFRTGQECITTTAGASALKQNICNNMSWLQAQCMSNLNVDIRSFTSFTGADSPEATTVNSKGATVFNSALEDTSGGPGTVNVLTTYYQWPLMTPFLYGGLETIPNSGQHILISTEVMSFEPFGSCTNSLG
jgi:Flp pilus assembly protein TadG